MKVQPGRRVIVNADDFGQSEGVNRGIVEAHECGIVTSASLLVRHRGAKEAAAYARKRPELSVGLHLDLGEWRFSRGAWRPVYTVDAPTPEAVRSEARAQLELFRELVGSNPTHIDSHQHAHRKEPLRSVAAELSESLCVPLREFDSRVRYRGDFFGHDGEKADPDRITVAAFVQLLHELESGITELGCHPGYADDLDSAYREERALEITTLCSPLVRRVLDEERLTLCGFADLGSLH